MDEATRATLCGAAVRAAQAIGYTGAGTVEFIVDASEGLRPDRAWFMEMNTRLQVEHPVTEAVTGLDLVEWQLRIAAGEPLPLAQAEIPLKGWAMEARLYAEDPVTGFLPSVGRLDHFVLPTRARVDTGYEAGDAVSPFYDPMLAKLIVHAQTRDAAARALEAACAAVEVWPVKTNAAFLARCAGHPDFRSGQVDTAFIDDRLADLTRRPVPELSPDVVAAVAAPRPIAGEAATSPWANRQGASGFRLNADPARATVVFVDGDPREAAFAPLSGAPVRLDVRGDAVVFAEGAAFVVSRRSPVGVAQDAGGDGQVRAPMPGRLVRVAVATGDEVAQGQVLVVLEAMKMEHALTAPHAGIVAELMAGEGEQVSEGAILARLTANT
jgi:acetyl/propionyl-CoA carboxylase alpha subunit